RFIATDDYPVRVERVVNRSALGEELRVRCDVDLGVDAARLEAPRDDPANVPGAADGHRRLVDNHEPGALLDEVGDLTSGGVDEAEIGVAVVLGGRTDS